jgi:hypothetical protein
MKFNRLGAFTLGVVITAVSVGAVSFVNAAGNGTLKACANKTTGLMRYISKGSCKKTETTLSWNQMGPTGLSGSAGTNGTAGANGTNGSAGAKGEVGPAGQNFHAIDATGKDLGIITQGNASEVTVYSEGGLWPWQTQAYLTNSSLYIFRDSSCTVPLAINTNAVYVAASQFVFPSNNRWILAKSAQSLPTAAYKASGQVFDIKSLTTIYIWNTNSQTCTSKTPSTFFFEGENIYATDLTTVSLPTYTAPLTIVAK